jgi:hypothetical protein
MKTRLIVFLCFVSAVAQAQYATPRTPDGAPDLQGIWTSATLTRLERPAGIDRLVLTDAEALAWESRNSASVDAGNAPTDPDAGAPRAGGNVGGYNRGWLDPGSRLAMVNGEFRSSLIVDPENGRIPYSAAGRLRLAELALRSQSTDGPEPRQLGDRCILGYGSTGGPPMVPVLYNNNYQIVQSPGHVLILVEMNHNARIVRIGGQHPPPHIRLWLGDSIGRWEGDTLVVETTNFHPDQEYRPAIQHTVYVPADATVTERFTRVAADQLLYEFAVEHDGAFTQTWRGQIPLTATDGPIYEYACHEGNYALASILAGARAAERAATEGGSQ